MNMKRWSLLLLFVAACSLSAAAGFWFGFREAWWLGPAADSLPRGALAVGQLKAIAAGKPATATYVPLLDSDVDTGLTFGYEVFHHPLRDFLRPVWGIEVYPEYEKYAVRLADYRKQYPSPYYKPDPNILGTPLSEISETLAEGYRRGATKLNFMIERYARKP